ncbi:MAG: dTMP kinase [Alsobacter sp.]
MTLARGRFVTLEGGEGAGKSTQLRLLGERLAAAGIDCLVTREPGGSPGAEAIRDLLLGPQSRRFAPLAEALLFGAARADHLATLIRPALRAGRWVLCDRFADSTRAYQGAAGGLPPETVTTLERLVVAETAPDLTIILDLDPAIGLARAAARRGAEQADRFEGEAASFHRKLRQAFLAIAAAEPMRCAVIDATRPADVIADTIWRVLRDRLAPDLPSAEGAA